MKTALTIAILFSATISQAASYSNWDNGGTCREYTPAGAFIRTQSDDVCRRDVGSILNWDSGGTCREYTPEGAVVRTQSDDICRYQETGVLVKKEGQNTQKPTATQCSFDNEQVMFSYTHKVAQQKNFKDSRNGMAMDQCKAAGFERCLVQRERSSSSHGSTVGQAINAVNPFSILFGVGFKESYTTTQKGIVIGYKFKIKSSKELRKDLCPQLNVCALSATATELSEINRISDQIACPK